MPKPKSPVIEGLEPYEVVFGDPDIGQPQYIPLPALRSPEGQVMSRWELTNEERLWIANGADVFITIHTFNEPYPPTSVTILNKSSSAEHFRNTMRLDAELNKRLG